VDVIKILSYSLGYIVSVECLSYIHNTVLILYLNILVLLENGAFFHVRVFCFI